MIRLLTTTALLLVLALPVAARDLDPSAGNNGVTGRGAGNRNSGGGNDHPNAVGKRFSSPPSFPWSGGASGKHGSQGRSGGGSYSKGSSGNGNGNGNDPGGYGNTGRL